jgi:Recombination endonuclease VII
VISDLISGQVVQTKRCGQCRREKSAEEFKPSQSTSDKLSYRCIDCSQRHSGYHHKNKDAINARKRSRRDPNKARAQYVKYRSLHREEANQRRRLRYKEDPVFREKMLSGKRESRAANPEQAKRLELGRNLKFRYGMTLEEWDQRMATQRGRCASCGNVFTKTGKGKPVLDHCHVTGVTRSILCNGCNTAEGYLGSPEAALALYNYMLKHELLSYPKP